MGEAEGARARVEERTGTAEGTRVSESEGEGLTVWTVISFSVYTAVGFTKVSGKMEGLLERLSETEPERVSEGTALTESEGTSVTVRKRDSERDTTGESEGERVDSWEKRRMGETTVVGTTTGVDDPAPVQDSRREPERARDGDWATQTEGE